MRATIGLAAAVFVAATGFASAKSTRMWNLTDNTITMLQLAPAGTATFGKDLTKTDKDGSVDHDERLKLIDVPTGTYDARLADSKGRTCIVKGLGIKEGEVFSIEEKQLVDCHR